MGIGHTGHAAHSHAPLTAMLRRDLSANGQRACEIAVEMEGMLHKETHPTIGHIHNVLDGDAKAHANSLRGEIRSMGGLSDADKRALQEVLDNACGSVKTFIATGQLPDTRFESQLYYPLLELDAHFHEPGRGHVHRKPGADELEDMERLKRTVLNAVQELKETDGRIRPALRTVDGTTLEFIMT